MSNEVHVSKLPLCDFNSAHGEAEYDFRTADGRWANGCIDCWQIHRASEQLGTGHGQRLTTEPVAPQYDDEVLAAADALGCDPSELV